MIDRIPLRLIRHRRLLYRVLARRRQEGFIRVRLSLRRWRRSGLVVLGYRRLVRLMHSMRKVIQIQEEVIQEEIQGVYLLNYRLSFVLQDDPLLLSKSQRRTRRRRLLHQCLLLPRRRRNHIITTMRMLRPTRTRARRIIQTRRRRQNASREDVHLNIVAALINNFI